MMLPILISVSVAPVSYFFCASTPLEDAASTANAAEKIASLLVTTGIPVLPCDEAVHVRAMAFLERKPFGLAALNTIRPRPSTKSPPRDAREAAALVDS